MSRRGPLDLIPVLLGRLRTPHVRAPNSKQPFLRPRLFGASASPATHPSGAGTEVQSKTGPSPLLGRATGR